MNDKVDCSANRIFTLYESLRTEGMPPKQAALIVNAISELYRETDRRLRMSWVMFGSLIFSSLIVYHAIQFFK